MKIFGFLAFCLLAVTPTLGFYGPSDDVVELDPEKFDSLVLADDYIWVIEFYAPWCGHCKSLVPEYKKLGTALKGVVKVGAINADDHQSVGARFGVKGFPTIKIFSANKRKPIDYTGARTAKAIAEAALAEAKKKVQNVLNGGSSKSSDSEEDAVIELTDENFERLVMNSEEPWLVEFFAPWCGHCKNLAPEWARAAKELKGKVKLGALDATVHQVKASQFSVRGYPTIKYFPAGKKSSRDVVDYDGGRTSNDIVTWAMDKYTVNIPPPELIEIYDEASFDKACDNKPLCVVSILPHILDCNAKCRNGFLKTLQDAGEKFKQKQWGWAWVEGGSQTELEESLELGGFGYPAMAVVNFKKMKFSILKGSFSSDGINEFLRDISFGRGHTAPVKGAKKPKIVTYQAWDGKDGQLPTEEDIDLSDVTLDDDVKEEL